MKSPDPPESPMCPSWITEEMIEETQRVWGPFYDQPITRDEAIDMMTTIARLGKLILNEEIRKEEAQRREEHLKDI